jgi:nucleotide-binding universal stress UspA family protein
MKILVAVDGSECSKRAITALIERPWKAEDQFLVVSVVEPVPADLGVGFVPPPRGSIEQTMYDEAAEICGTAAALLKKAMPAQQVEVKVATGLAAETICAVARDDESDLLVIGSHGRKGLAHFFLGSVAEEVLKRSPCSVEVVKCKESLLKAHDPKKNETKKNTKENKTDEATMTV